MRVSRLQRWFTPFFVVLLGCASGPRSYDLDALLPAPQGTLDSLKQVSIERVQRLGLKVYDAQEALERIRHLDILVVVREDFLYADNEHGCGLFSIGAICKQIDILLVSFDVEKPSGREQLHVSAFTYKRAGLLANWRFERPSSDIRRAADSLLVEYGAPPNPKPPR